MPCPSQSPTSVTSSSASGSPSAAARGDVLAGEPVGVAVHPLQQPAGRRRDVRATSRAVCAERGAAGVLLPAAAVAAGAEPAVGHDPHVPPLPRHAVRAALQPAVEHDAAADAGAQRDHQRQVGAAGGAVAVLGPGGGVGVVAHPQRPLQPRREVLAQRRVPPGQVRAEQHGVAGAVEPAGRADPDADQFAVVPGREFLDDGGDRVLGVADRGAGRGPPRGRQDRAVGRDDAAGDLRAADVDAEGGQLGRVARRSRDLDPLDRAGGSASSARVLGAGAAAGASGGLAAKVRSARRSR